MSETRARASRFALAFGSLARKGLIGARVGVALGTVAPARGVGEPDTAASEDGVGRAVGKALERGAAEGVARTAGPENGGVTGRARGAEALAASLPDVGALELALAGVGRANGDAAGPSEVLDVALVAADAAGRANGAGAAPDWANGARDAETGGAIGGLDAGRTPAGGAGRMNGGAAGRGGWAAAAADDVDGEEAAEPTGPDAADGD